MSGSTPNIGNVWIGTYSKGLVRLKEEFLGVHEAGMHAGLRVYPNPAASGSTIQFSGILRDAHVRVLTADAKIVYDAYLPGETTSLDLPGLSSGTYLLRVSEGSGTAVVRITIL